MHLAKSTAVQICKKLDENLVRFSFLAKGNHNDNYLIQTNIGKYVLRIENNSQFNNLKKEYTLLKSLKPGLGPRVYFFDKSHKIMPYDYFVEEFVEGKHPSKLNEKFVVLMAKWLKKLHSQKKKCEKYSLLNAVEPYYKNFKKYETSLSPEIITELDSLFYKVLAFCKRNNNIFNNRTTNSLLHRDLSTNNIIYDGEKIKLLDWEFSNYNFQEWDIVYFIESQKLNNRLKNIFLKHYGYSTSKSAMKRLVVISLLNTCGNIGYSVWRLGLVKQGKLKKNEKPVILRRLNQDIRFLRKIIKELEEPNDYENKRIKS